jgi:hypothetical protein
MTEKNEKLEQYTADEILELVSESVLSLKGKSFDWTKKYSPIFLAVNIEYLEHLKKRFS